MKVFVYYNLHKKCLSLKAMEGPNKGRVIAHRDSVTLVNGKFKVSEAGRQRVLKEKRKNVHAGVLGDISDKQFNLNTRVTYNPYKFNSFVKADSLEPIYEFTSAELKGRVIYVE
jgi:hypothetical protein